MNQPRVADSPFDCLDEASRAFVARVMASARDYLDAHVSFVTEFVGGEKIIRDASGPAAAAGVAPGTRFELEDTYCHRVLSGTLPEVVFDTRMDERVRTLAITRQLDIASYMGVPVKLADGRALGTLCCINFPPDPAHRERDLSFMRVLADLIGHQLHAAVQAQALQRDRHAAVQRVLSRGGPSMVYQPIVDMAHGGLVGVEALSRFDDGLATPDVWFREAWATGAGVELEVSAIANALRALPQLPDDAYLSVNVSPQTLPTDAFARVIAGLPRGRVLVEMTEHAIVEDYGALVQCLGALREAGLRIAIDDVGAGYASLRHVLEIRPDVAKLDMSLTRQIDADPARQALALAVMAFAERTGVDVVAEGVETAAEAAVLREVGVRCAQGYHFARPDVLANVVRRPAAQPARGLP